MQHPDAVDDDKALADAVSLLEPADQRNKHNRGRQQGREDPRVGIVAVCVAQPLENIFGGAEVEVARVAGVMG